jgi:hypothetical protein
VKRLGFEHNRTNDFDSKPISPKSLSIEEGTARDNVKTFKTY